MSARHLIARVTDGRNPDAQELARLRRLVKVERARSLTALSRQHVAEGKYAAEVEKRRKVEAHRDRLMAERDEWRSLYRRDHMAWAADAPEGERTIPLVAYERKADPRG